VIILIAQVVDWLARILSLIVIVDVVLSYFMSPYDSVRMFFDRLVYPLLLPIRRVVPPLGMIDFSPLVLLVLIQVLDYVITRLLFSIG
jgi:YggT family protein